jgi:hypothetical protein
VGPRPVSVLSESEPKNELGIAKEKDREQNKSAEHGRKKHVFALSLSLPRHTGILVPGPEVAQHGEDDRVLGKNATYRLPQKSPNT